MSCWEYSPLIQYKCSYSYHVLLGIFPPTVSTMNTVHLLHYFSPGHTSLFISPILHKPFYPLYYHLVYLSFIIHIIWYICLLSLILSCKFVFYPLYYHLVYLSFIIYIIWYICLLSFILSGIFVF